MTRESTAMREGNGDLKSTGQREGARVSGYDIYSDEVDVSG
jgi:hypothetical protein